MCSQKICTLECPTPSPCIITCTYVSSFSAHFNNHPKSDQYSSFSMSLHHPYRTTWSRVLLEKLICIKNSPVFYGKRKFIDVFTRARRLSLSRARSTQSLPLHLTSCRSTLILSFHLRLVLPTGPFPSGFPTKNIHAPLLSLIRDTYPPTPPPPSYPA